MYTHPDISSQIAHDRHRDRLARAGQQRMARQLITRRTRRLAIIVAIAASALLALATAVPAMAATASVPHYGQPVAPPAQVQIVTAAGMPGWQITLIAAAAAIAAAIVAVAADRARTARRHQTAPTL